MASTDLEAFIEERLRAYDPNIDLTTGSAAQQQVVQPILRRVGPDPFTMPLEQFIGTRLIQEFPEISTEDGDGIMDTLVKPARLLMEPLIQENKRVKASMSFSDALTLTTTEAEALGANFFSARERGDFARVTVRIYFTAPQNAVVTPGNYCFTSAGIRFLPTAIQTISANQMLFNKESSYYYFDVSTIADNAGDGYNVEVGAITGIYGMNSAVRVTNKMRAIGGLPEEDAPTYIDRIEQELTERSLVTLKGILANIRKYFPAITRAAVVGFNDPEMMRDILQGEGIGPILASGIYGIPVSDGAGGPSRRFMVNDLVDFTALIGPIGYLSETTTALTGFTLTVVGKAFLSGVCADLPVIRVVDAHTLEVAEQVFKPWYSNVLPSYWMLRRNTLSISGIEGGTLLTGTNGEVVVESGKVHIGGMTDIHVRGTSLDQSVLVLDAVTDDEPLLSGNLAERYNNGGSSWLGFTLTDLTLGGNYLIGSDTFIALDAAKDRGLSLQIMDGDVGSYRILDVIQAVDLSPVIITDPAPVGYPLDQRWKILDTLDLNLRVPRETKLLGADLFTVQGNPLAQIPSVLDLSVYGIGKGDVLELSTGPDKGLFNVIADTGTNQLTLDRDFTMSTVGVLYRIYRKLSTESLLLPLVRIKSIDVLDTGGQPVGVTIPYADPVDIRSFDFTTPTNALMVDVCDASVGCVGKVVTAAPSTVNGKYLCLCSPVWPGDGIKNIQFLGVTSLGDIADQINTQAGDHVAGVLDGERIVISPLRTQYTIKVQPLQNPTDDALSHLFDTSDGVTEFATNYIRSQTVESLSGGWARHVYDAHFDAVQVVSSTSSGFAYAPTALWSLVLKVDTDFPPAVNALVRVGPRAVGRARCYFLEPTTFEVTSDARFEATLEDGTVVQYVADPTIGTLKYPPPPTTERAKDAVTTTLGNYGVLSTTSVDFIKKGILPGDEVIVDFVPIVSDYANAGPTIVGIALTTFIVKIEGVEKTIVFSSDDTDVTAVTMAGIEKQLNRVLGADVASFTSSGFLELEPSYKLQVVDGTSLGYFWTAFNTTFPPAGPLCTNISAEYKGALRYVVFSVNKNSLYVLGTFVGGTRQQFTITRPGTQRTGTTQMALNTTYAGLYYADVQIISVGSGALYNIVAHAQMKVSGHYSLGYRLSTTHEHLAFSTVEEPFLHITPTIISVGSSDDPESALQVAGQNLQVNYNWSSLVSSLQSFVSSDSERVVNENALVRHLLPYFVRFDMTYRGGPTESNVKQQLTTYINGLGPDEVLEAVQVQNTPITLGAGNVSTPVNLVAVVHQADRKVVLEQSTNYLNMGRLAGFFTETLNVQRKTS